MLTTTPPNTTAPNPVERALDELHQDVEATAGRMRRHRTALIQALAAEADDATHHTTTAALTLLDGVLDELGHLTPDLYVMLHDAALVRSDNWATIKGGA